MCEPMTWTALALTAAGTATQAAGARRAQKAMTGAAVAESYRQKGFRDESQALFEESLSKQDAGSQNKRLADAVVERQEAAEASQAKEPIAEVPVQGGAPQVVADETSARVAQGNISALREARLAAALQGYGDVQLGNALLNTRYGQKQANIAGFMRDSAGVLGTELEAAARKGDKLKAAGQGLQALGAIVGTAGAMGYNPFGTAGAPLGVPTHPPSPAGVNPFV